MGVHRGGFMSQRSTCGVMKCQWAVLEVFLGCVRELLGPFRREVRKDDILELHQVRDVLAFLTFLGEQ